MRIKRNHKPQPVHPQTFTYNARFLKVSRVLVLTAAVAVGGFAPMKLALNASRLWSELGPGLFIAMVATTLAYGASMAAMFYVVGLGPITDGLRRPKQRITVDADGICYEDDQRSVQARWTDVVGVSVVYAEHWSVLARRIIVTTYGQFDYTRAISGFQRLDAVIKQNAVNAVLTREIGDDIIHPQPQTPGARIYHYRTYTNRALLMFPLGFMLIAIVIGILQATGLSDRGSPATPWLMGGVSLALWALAFHRYRTVFLRTDGLGITWSGPGRKVFIPWSDIRFARKAGSDFSTHYVIKGSKATIRVFGLISDFESLIDEIESHSALPQRA